MQTSDVVRERFSDTAPDRSLLSCVPWSALLSHPRAGRCTSMTERDERT